MHLNFVAYKLADLHSGLVVSLLEYCKGLLKLGHSVSIFALSIGNKTKEEFMRLGVKLYSVESANYLLYDLRMFLLSKKIAKDLYTLIQINYTKGPFIVYADEAISIINYRTEDKWIYICQGDWDLLLLFDNFRKRFRKSSIFLSLFFVRRIRKKAKLISRFDLIAANSKFTALLFSFLYDLTITNVIYPPIAQNLLRRNFTDLQSNLSEPKDIYALAMLRNEYEGAADFINLLGSKFRIKVFGGARLPSCENVGFVENNQLTSLYSNALVLISPSNNEYFGRHIVESLSLGTPVLAYNTCGASELIIDKYNGWLANDKEDFIKILTKLFYEGYPKEIRINCLASSVKYNTDSICESILKLVR